MSAGLPLPYFFRKRVVNLFEVCVQLNGGIQYYHFVSIAFHSSVLGRQRGIPDVAKYQPEGRT